MTQFGEAVPVSVSDGQGNEAQYRRAAGAVFNSLRQEQGWSLREFGERTRTAHTSLYAVERGEATPGIDVLGRVATAFGLDLAGLLTLIIDRIDQEPAGLSAILAELRQLSPEQLREVEHFIDYLHYRDQESPTRE